MKIRWESIAGTSEFALIAAAWTANQVLKIINLYKEDLKSVVNSNHRLHGSELAQSGILFSDFSNLKDFEGVLIIACSGGLRLQHSLEMNSDLVLNYFYNYEADHDFYLPMFK